MFSQKLGSGSSAHSCALDLDGISRQQAVTSREKDGRFDNRPLPNADIRRSKWQVGRMLVVAGCQRSLSCMLPGTVAQKGGRKLCRKVSRWHCFSVPFFTQQFFLSNYDSLRHSWPLGADIICCGTEPVRIYRKRHIRAEQGKWFWNWVSGGEAAA